MRTMEQIQADADDTRRPFSNSTEFEMWADDKCYECVNDTMGVANPDPEVFCPILSAALLGGWPKEWTRKHLKFGKRIEGTTRVEVSETTADDPDGFEYVDTCTEFEERRNGGGGGDAPKPTPPRVECDGQLDIIDAYLDTAVAELTPNPVAAVTR